MNERIRELADQAGLKYYNWITNESNVVDGDFRYPRAEDLQMFAELIVRECADLFPHQFTDEQYQRRIDKTIKKHFGVEE
jgi:hypothetical protein